jgi:hypothetical protein
VTVLQVAAQLSDCWTDMVVHVTTRRADQVRVVIGMGKFPARLAVIPKAD